MRRINSEDKAGLYITVIFHLTVIIVLLAVQIGSQLKEDASFLMDFSKQEETERLEKEADFKESISRRLDELISGSSAGTPVRNVTVDRSAPLKDDRKRMPRSSTVRTNGCSVTSRDWTPVRKMPGMRLWIWEGQTRVRRERRTTGSIPGRRCSAGRLTDARPARSLFLPTSATMAET